MESAMKVIKKHGKSILQDLFLAFDQDLSLEAFEKEKKQTIRCSLVLQMTNIVSV
jgi:hypothetical protein